MTANRVSIKQIRYFDAIARCGSFRLAAEALNLTQPPLSRQIQLLEAELGAKLFDRSARQVRLTPTGEFFRTECQSILERIDVTWARTQAFTRGTIGTLRLGLTDDFMNSPTYGQILSFMADNPDIHMSTVLGISDELLRKLESAELDLILTNLPLDYDQTQFKTVETQPTRLMVVLPPGHAWSDRKYIRPAMLHGQPMLLMSEGSMAPFAVQYRKLFAAEGIEPEYRPATNHVDLQMQMVRHGLGLGLLSELSIGVQHKDLKQVPIRHPLAFLDHAIVYRPNAASPVLNRLIDIIG